MRSASCRAITVNGEAVERRNSRALFLLRRLCVEYAYRVVVMPPTLNPAALGWESASEARKEGQVVRVVAENRTRRRQEDGRTTARVTSCSRMTPRTNAYPIRFRENQIACSRCRATAVVAMATRAAHLRAGMRQ